MARDEFAERRFGALGGVLAKELRVRVILHLSY
jgi:hypothetical protein